MSIQPDDTLFMTGATGFLGQFVLRDLLARGVRLAVMVRPPRSGSSERLRRLMAEIGTDLDACLRQGQLILVEGVLPDTLPEPTWGRTYAILHCAASIKLFLNGDGDPFHTNVEGTRAMLAWAERQGIHRLFAVSTAYTCGWSRGLVRETFHREVPEFQTDYERSKWLAEGMLEAWAEVPDRSLTVFRPSFLVGESQTGYTTQFGGFYQLARLIALLKQQHARNGNGNGEPTCIPLRIPGRAEDAQDFVPVDFVSRLMTEVILRPEFHGRIYHLTSPERFTNGFIKQCFEEYFGLCGGTFADPDTVLGRCSPDEALLWDQYAIMTPRVMHCPQFDLTHTREVMQASGVRFPVLDRQRVFRLLDYAAARGWGRSNGHR